MTTARVKWPLNVLVADDTDTDLELYRMALGMVGNVRSFTAVSDGQELIDYLQCHPPFDETPHAPPDIIILDIKMPRMDGMDALKWLKKHPDCSAIPIIMISNSWHERDVKRAYDLCVNAFFTKPASLKELANMLRLIFEFWTCAKRPPSMAACPKEKSKV